MDAALASDAGDYASVDAEGFEDASAPVQLPRRACQLVSGSEGPSGELSLRVEEVARGLEVPWDLAFLPNGDILVTERPGRVRIVRGAMLASAPLLEVQVAQIPFAALGTEGGLLGILLHPAFAETRELYLYYTVRNATDQVINRLGLYRLDESEQLSLVRVLLDEIPGGDHHHGGRMRLGPDGKLYLGVGAWEPSLAQKPDQLPGKLLRLNLDGSVPNDNPTSGSYVFLSGLRNTQGFDWFDRQHLLVMDHGPTYVDPGVDEVGWDEFNVGRAGENLGWPITRHCDTSDGVVEPVLVWEKSLPPAGAAIYTGTSIPEWTGSLLVGILGLPFTDEGNHLHRIKVRADNPYIVEKHEVYLKNTYGRLRTVLMGPDGHLYITTSNCDGRGFCPFEGDRILRIVGADSP